MAGMVEITCICGCGRKRKVRAADVARGWGKYFDKSCKAKHQEKRTAQMSKFLNWKSKASDDSDNDDWDDCDSMYWDNSDNGVSNF